MITADQLVAHGIGDYVLQSDWMAQNKSKSSAAALIHAIAYSLPFLVFGPSVLAFSIILVGHFFIDRFALARYIVWAKNFLAPSGENSPWLYCKGTGYDGDRPVWLAVWLTIIADNVLHVLINGSALRWL